MGVGSFVFSQGVVSALPLLKNISHLRQPLGSKVRVACIKAAPILLLGVIRVILVKGTEYPVCLFLLQPGVIFNTTSVL